MDTGTEDDKLRLATLVGSRICHDLISPVGAVQNGVELLELSRNMAGPELELVADSVRSASTRARFFRIAYGGASQQLLGRGEVAGILEEMSAMGRMNIVWDVEHPQPRAMVRMAFLALQCCESAMPLGGDLVVRTDGPDWSMRASSARLQSDNDLWDDLMSAPDLESLTPAQVQFALLPLAAQGLGRTVTLEREDTALTLRF